MLRYIFLSDNKIGLASSTGHITQPAEIIQIKEENGEIKLVIEHYEYMAEFPCSREILALIVDMVSDSSLYPHSYALKVTQLLKIVETIQADFAGKTIKIKSKQYDKEYPRKIKRFAEKKKEILDLLLEIINKRREFACSAIVFESMSLFRVSFSSNDIPFIIKKGNEIIAMRLAARNAAIAYVDEVSFDSVASIVKLIDFIENISPTQEPSIQDVKKRLKTIFAKVLLPNNFKMDFDVIASMLKHKKPVEPYKIKPKIVKTNPRHVYAIREDIIFSLIYGKNLPSVEIKVPVLINFVSRMHWDKYAKTKIVKINRDGYEILAFLPKAKQTPAEVIDGILNVFEFYF